MNKIFKKIFFVLIVLILIFGVGIVISKGNFKQLEGYMYSFAANILDDATSSNATSCDATSSNATSSNATSCDATSSNATSSNATSSTSSSIKVTNSTSIIAVETSAPIQPVEEDDLEFNNSEISKTELDKIIASSENIIINIDKQTIVSKEIFNAIKGTSRQLTINSNGNQMIFNGKDILESKDIDSTITSNLISNDSILQDINQDGIVINFANNGKLPGTATIKIKTTYEMENLLNFKTMFLYFYDEGNEQLLKLSNTPIYEDGFINFNIDHNSKYIIVNEEISENNESTIIEDNEVTFLESHKMYILIIALSIIAILFVVTILILDKKTKRKTSEKQ